MLVPGFVFKQEAKAATIPGVTGYSSYEDVPNSLHYYCSNGHGSTARECIKYGDLYYGYNMHSYIPCGETYYVVNWYTCSCNFGFESLGPGLSVPITMQETKQTTAHTPGDAATCTTAQTCTRSIASNETGSYSTYTCGAVITAALGHAWVTTKTVAPTCTVAGTLHQTCSRCSTTQVADGAAATGHTNTTVYNSKTIKTHTKTVTCSVCSTQTTTTENCSFSSGYCASCKQGVTYYVVFNGSGNTGGTMSNMTLVYGGGAKALTTNSFTKTGYTFQGWATTSGGTTVKYTNKASVSNLTTTSEGKVNLYAVWKANTYAVKYNANGGSGTMSNSSHTYDTAKTLTANAFTRTGYTFKGWSTTATGAVVYANSASVKNLATSGTFNLYAVWEANTYTVAYNANGGSGTMSSVTHTYDTAKTLTANTFTKTGYTFQGWATSNTATAAQYENKESVTNLATSGTVTLYAVWKVNSYTVKFHGNGATGGSVGDQTFTYDVAQKLSSNAFIRTGYTFLGWHTDSAATSAKYTNGQSVSKLTATNGGTVNLYAIWQANSYTVKFDGNSSTSGSMSDQSFTYDQESALTANSFKREYVITYDLNYSGASPETATIAYSFLGWNRTKTASNATYFDGETISNLTSTVNGNVTLYAIWSATSTNLVTPTRQYYSFLGWSTDADDGTVEYNGGESYTPTANVTLYAVWKVNNECSFTTQPTNKTVAYPNTATFTAEAKGMALSTVTYQWQQSHDEGNNWENIDGASSSSYTPPVSMTAGVYYYRLVATSTVASENSVVTVTSGTVRLTVKKADGIIEGSDNDGAAMSSNDNLLFSLDDGATVVGTFSCNPGATMTVTSADTTKVRANLENGVLTLTPTGTSSTGVEVVIKTSESDNYETTTFVLNVYVCDGPTITYSTDPSNGTNTDVTATITVVDELYYIDPSHSIVSVSIAGNEQAVVPGDNTFTYTITTNGTYTVIAEDSFGSVSTKEIVVDWIDKEAPEINVTASYDPATATFATYIIAYDNMSSVALMEYCWDYDPDNPANNVWTATNVRSVVPGTTVSVAARDAVGNIAAIEDYLVDSNGSSNDGQDTSALDTVTNDMSGKIFGKTSFLENYDATAMSYINGVYELYVKVKPKSSSQYIEGYLEFAGVTFPVSWYSDEAMTVAITTMSDDGTTNLARGTAYGKVVLDPALFATKTIRNATAELYLVRYSDSAMDDKVAAEKYSMPCSIDVTAPSLSATYNEYTRIISVRSRDAIAGIESGVSYSIGSTNGFVGTSDDLLYPTSADDTNSFTITFTAEDKLGNLATKTYTFKPYTAVVNNNPGGAGDGGAGGEAGVSNSDVNVYGYKTRMFTIYIINGSKSNK